MEIPIIGAEQDLPGCIKAPVLLQEVIRACSEGNNLKQPVMTFLAILAEFAQTAVTLDSHAMKLFALRLGLFNMSNEDLKKALSFEAKKLKEELAAQKEAQPAVDPKEADHDSEDRQ